MFYGKMSRRVISSRIKEDVERVLSTLFKSEKDYEVEVMEDEWVSIRINLYEGGLGLKDLNSIAKKLSHKINVDVAGFSIFLFEAKEMIDRIELGFSVPYCRRLSESESKHKFIYIESCWRDYFPSPDKDFIVESYGKQYVFSCDHRNRIRRGASKWFNDHPDLKKGDMIVIQKSPIRILKNVKKCDYLLTIKR